MPKKLKPAPAKPATETETKPEPLPAWAVSTPMESGYSLYAYDCSGENLEEIGDLTREEYIALKRRLALLRYPHRACEVNPDPDRG